jgi:hypothetical protein
MKITEKMLLDNFNAIAGGGSKISIIGKEQINWEYRYEHDEGAAVCDRDTADFITLEYGRDGEIKIDVNCNNHPALSKIARLENELWGDELAAVGL